MDIPLAVLSKKPQLLYNYFKQLFAQVTNPPIDALREEIVTGTEVFIGASGNFTEDAPDNCKKLRLESPILDSETYVITSYSIHYTKLYEDRNTTTTRFHRRIARYALRHVPIRPEIYRSRRL